MKTENQVYKYLHPVSQRTTDDLSQIIDFSAQDRKEELGFEDNLAQDFDKYFEDFSPTFHEPNRLV